MKVNHFFAASILVLVVAISGCRRESTADRMAVLTMNVDGVPFTSDKTNSGINETNNSFFFATESQSNLHGISVLSFLGHNLDSNYVIDINTVSAATSASTISQFMFINNGNAIDQFSFPFISEKGHLNYRVVKKQTIGTGGFSQKFDVDFSGVFYASENDSVVITNGTIRY